MDILGTLINALVLAAVGVIVIRITGGRFDDLKGRFDDLKERFEDLKDRFDRLEDRVDKRIDGIQATVEAMRSDLTAVALAVGARPRPTSAGGQGQP